MTFLAAVGIFSLANAVFAAGRRRRHDLAVLRVLGHTPASNRVAVMAMTLTATAMGRIVAVPVGVALGRTLRRMVAEGASLEGDAATPVLAVVALFAGAMTAAGLIAAVPACSAARRSPGPVLRAE